MWYSACTIYTIESLHKLETLIPIRKTEPTPSKRLTRGVATLDSVATTSLANIHITVATLQDILVVTSIAHLAAKSSARRPRIDALEAARVLALVIFLELCEHLVDTSTSLIREHVWPCISIDDFLRSFFDAIRISVWTATLLPASTADVAELRAAPATTFC